MNLQLTTCLAANTHAGTAAVAAYLAQQLNLAAEFIIEPAWQARFQQIKAGQIHIGWICGYPYIRTMAEPNSALEIVAAPVMAAPRYENRPIYFSDVVVRADNPIAAFEQLRGAVWAYNEAGSHSGSLIVRHKLAQMGETGAFFGKTVASGAHWTSLQLVLAGEADGAAIDSTVMDAALRDNPSLAGQIRIIEALGPSPIPPWVIHKSVPAALRQAIRQTLTQMHLDPVGQQLLAKGEMVRFETAVDANYDPIRQMLQAAQHIQL